MSEERARMRHRSPSRGERFVSGAGSRVSGDEKSREMSSGCHRALRASRGAGMPRYASRRRDASFCLPWTLPWCAPWTHRVSPSSVDAPRAVGTARTRITRMTRKRQDLHYWRGHSSWQSKGLRTKRNPVDGCEVYGSVGRLRSPGSNQRRPALISFGMRRRDPCPGPPLVVVAVAVLVTDRAPGASRKCRAPADSGRRVKPPRRRRNPAVSASSA